MAKYICGGGKYMLGGPNEDSIGLPISISNLPEKTNAEGYLLSVRTVFHVTLVAIGKIIEKHKVTSPDFLDKIVSDFCEFTQKNNVDLLRFRDELKFASEKEKRSIIMMCDISNLNKFFDFINEKYNLQVEYPPTHVTLYTLQQDIGIFLTDSKDIKTMTKSIKNPGIKLKWKKF
jgi:hypothetical protein